MLRAGRTADAPAEAKLIGWIFEANMPVMAGAMLLRIERNLGDESGFVQFLQDERHRRTVLAQEREIDGIADQRRSQRQWPATKNTRSHEGKFNSRANVRPLRWFRAAGANDPGLCRSPKFGIFAFSSAKDSLQFRCG